MSNLKSFTYVVIFGLASSAMIANPPDFNPRIVKIDGAEMPLKLKK